MQERDVSRNNLIRKIRSEGKSLSQIADLFKISRQRVHQIVGKMRLDSNENKEYTDSNKNNLTP